MKNENVLIIGTGVLGAYLSEFLLKKKYNIFVTSRKLKKNYLNYRKLNIQKKINFKKFNISNKKEIKQILKKINPQYIYYFAGISSITQSFKQPKETMVSNYIGAKNFLEIIDKENIKTKFFKANSGYIFDSKGKKITYKSKLIKSNSPYTKSKIKSYKLINRYRNKKLQCSNLIFFNVESPLRSDGYLIKKICNSIKLIKKKKLQKLKIGNINCIRDFSWAPEIMRAVYYFSKLNSKNILLGTGKEMSIKQVLNILFKFKKLNYRNHIIIDKKLFRKNEQLVISCSINQTVSLLKKFKWKPKVYGKKLLIRIFNN